MEAFDLDEGGGAHGEDGEEEAEAHALEGGEAAGVARAGAEVGDDELFVEWDDDEGVDGGEDGEGALGDDELGAEVPVGEGGLGDEEGGHLGEGDGERDGGCPYW